MDKKEGRHSIRIIVRMTENEYEKFDTLYKKAKEKSDGLRKSDFMRSQLIYENNEKNRVAEKIFVIFVKFLCGYNFCVSL